LESAAVFLRLAGIAEAARAVQNTLECLEIDCIAKVSCALLSRIAESVLTFTTDILLEVLDLSEGRVLTASAQQITEAVNSDTAVSALVEQSESLLVVGRSLRIELVRRHDCLWIDLEARVCVGNAF
jgi:hypothetical protein